MEADIANEQPITSKEGLVAALVTSITTKETKATVEETKATVEDTKAALSTKTTTAEPVGEIKPKMTQAERKRMIQEKLAAKIKKDD